MADPAFDTTSEEVHAAREDDWYVETTWGWAVLRYDEASALLRDRRFRQGNARWPAQNGIHSGLFSDWWGETLLSLEGDDHARIRRLMVPAFRNKTIAAMRPTFPALADELIDAFAPRGRVEFVTSSPSRTPPASSACCSGCRDDRVAAGGAVGRRPRRVVLDRRRQPGAADRGGAGRADGVRRRGRRRPPRAPPRRPGDHAGRRRGRADRPRAVGGAGVPRVRRAWRRPATSSGSRCRRCCGIPTSGRLLAERPELGAQRRRGGDAGQPDGDLGDPRGAGGRGVPAGCTSRAAASCRCCRSAAGTDPRAMPDPAFDITAQRPPHHGFGAGIHHCLGHFVARTDMAVALPQLAQRMPDAVPDGPGEWLPVSGNTGAVRFPIRFTADALTGSGGRVVHEAPAPVLAGLGGLDHRVGGLVEVRGRVLADRGVAAGDVAAVQALAQRHPAQPLVEAALADRVRRRSRPPGCASRSTQRAAGTPDRRRAPGRRGAPRWRRRASTPRRRAWPARRRPPRRRPSRRCGSRSTRSRSASIIASRIRA